MSLKKLWRRYGAAGLGRLVIDRIGQRLARLQRVDLFVVDRDGLNRAVALPLDAECRWLTADDVRRFAADAALDLESEIIPLADSDRHGCLGVIIANQLAAYAWFAVESVEPEHNCGVPLSLPLGTAYLFKAFTHPDWRGRKLYPALVAQMLDQLGERHATTRLLASVHWLNRASQRGCLRAGCQKIGRLVLIGNKPLVLSAPKVKLRQLGIALCFARSAREPSRNLTVEA